MTVLLLVIIAGCKKKSVTELVPKTADQDPKIPSVNINGAVLHSESFGHPDSTMIVCVHGGPGSDYKYMFNCKELADFGYKVVFYDQRGSGLSQRFNEDYYLDKGAQTIDLFCNELRLVIEHYKTNSNQKVVLFGFSWGAMIATRYVAQRPNEIKGLILAEPGGLKWDDIKEFFKKSRSFDLWNETFNNVNYMDEFIGGDKDKHEILDYKQAMLASKNEITGESIESAEFWRYGSVVNLSLFKIGNQYRPDFSEGIKNYKTNILFFYSGNNKAYTDEWAEKITSAYYLVEKHKVPGVGHKGIVSHYNTWRNITMQNILVYLNSIKY